MKMDKIERQKRIERAHFDLFNELETQYLPDNIIHKDEPDFRINTGNEILGIEHTQIFHEKKANGILPKEQEILQDRLRDFTEELHIKNHGIPGRYSMLFNPNEKIYKKDIDNLASSIIEMANNLNPSQGKSEIQNFGEWSNVIKSVSCHRDTLINWIEWDFGQSAWIPKLTKKRIKTEIEKKENKIPNYLNECDRVWLLIVAESFRLSSSFKINNTLTNETFFTNFSATYLLDAYQKQVFRLNVEKQY
jgi:hypothetical protein